MTELQEQTYRLLQQVPRGRVTTYKALARAVGTRGYRAIGQFMKHNPYAPDVPCHRVVASDGSLHGYNGGISKKMRLLQEEGIEVVDGKVKDFTRVLFLFPAPSRKG